MWHTVAFWLMRYSQPLKLWHWKSCKGHALNQKLRKCQAQFSGGTHLLVFKEAHLIFFSSVFQMFGKRSKWWQSKWKYLLLSAVTIAKPPLRPFVLGTGRVLCDRSATNHILQHFLIRKGLIILANQILQTFVIDFFLVLKSVSQKVNGGIDFKWVWVYKYFGNCIREIKCKFWYETRHFVGNFQNNALFNTDVALKVII